MSCSFVVYGQVAEGGPVPLQDTTRKKGKVFPSPLVGYSPETRLYFGAGVVWYLPPSKKYPESNPSVLKAVGVYTLNNQIESNISGESWMRNNLFKLEYSTSFYKFPNAFYGIGNNTSLEDREVYGFTFYNIQLNGQRRLRNAFFGGLALFVEHTALYDTEENGIFETREIPGESGGWNTGIGPAISYDSRDNIYFPQKGILANASLVAHQSWMGSAYEYLHLELELNHFHTLGKDDVLGFQYFLESVPGDAPFNRLAKLGGDKMMRGHFEGRYRDVHYATMQVEYRMTFWKYFGINIFTGLGEVAPAIQDLSLSGLHYSYGIGGRLFIVPEDKLSLRVDYAFDGEGNDGLYVTFREAF